MPPHMPECQPDVGGSKNLSRVTPFECLFIFGINSLHNMQSLVNPHRLFGGQWAMSFLYSKMSFFWGCTRHLLKIVSPRQAMQTFYS